LKLLPHVRDDKENGISSVPSDESPEKLVKLPPHSAACICMSDGRGEKNCLFTIDRTEGEKENHFPT
jgi:hypothetical protein